MAENKRSFILYTDLKSVVEKLIIKDREDGTNNSGELFYHILQYVNDENPEPMNFIIEMAFEPIKLQLKRDLRKYEEVREKNRQNALRRWGKGDNDDDEGNEKDMQTDAVAYGRTIRNANDADNDNDNDTGNDNDTVTDNVNETEIEIEIQNTGTERKKNNMINNSLNDNINTKNEIIKKESAKVDIYPFEDFWNDYDKKVGSKDKLIQKWKKLSDNEKALIREYIPLYKNAQPDKAYRKNPETFLNNKGWNDEIIPKQGNSNAFGRKQRTSGISDEAKANILSRLYGNHPAVDHTTGKDYGNEAF